MDKHALVLVGPPGSGKGTQSQKLLRRGFVQISTGDELRARIKKGDPHACAYDAAMRRGEYVDDSYIMNIVKYLGIDQTTHEFKPLILFDGIPRTRSQAEA